MYFSEPSGGGGAVQARVRSECKGHKAILVLSNLRQKKLVPDQGEPRSKRVKSCEGCISDTMGYNDYNERNIYVEINFNYLFCCSVK
jgi:hypothetical protein